MLTVILVCLATHRLTRLVVEDEIAKRPREAIQRAFERRAEARTGTVSPDTWQSKAAYLFGCPWCASIWVGGAVVLATALTVGVSLPVLTWLAASTVAGALAEWTDD